MVKSKKAEARRKLIKEKEKELKELQKEEKRSWWRVHKKRLFYSLERASIAVVSLVVFVLHCVNRPEEDSSRSDSLGDRALTPMAFGGDAMLQLGLVVASAAYLYADPVLLLMLDAITGFVIFLHICVTFQSGSQGLFLAVFLLAIIDLLLHTAMIVKAILKIKHYKKERSSFGGQERPSHPEGWSWSVAPRFSSGTWSQKGPSVSSARGSTESPSLRGSEVQEDFKKKDSKKSLLTQAQERWDREMKGKDTGRLTWKEENKSDMPKMSTKESVVPKSSSRDTSQIGFSSRSSNEQPSTNKSFNKDPRGSRNTENQPMAKKGSS